jgi:hypothetical protein
MLEMGTGEEDECFCAISFENSIRSSEKMKIPVNLHLHLPPPSSAFVPSFRQGNQLRERTERFRSKREKERRKMKKTLGRGLYRPLECVLTIRFRV